MDRLDGVDLDRSYADVSNEAQEIQNSPSTMYINNNEKNDDFEVIDDGSQPGGVRNFEDMSFEKSGRSSMLSSMISDNSMAVTDSQESERPLEISYGKVANEQRQDEFEILHSGYTPRTPKKGSETSVSEPRQLNVSQLVVSSDMGSHSPSPLPSDININKYLLSDEDDDGVQHSPVETFSVDRYFATSYSTHDEDETSSVATASSVATDSTRHSRADMPTVTLEHFDTGASSTDPTEEVPNPPSSSHSSSDLSEPRRNTYLSEIDKVLPDDDVDDELNLTDQSLDNAFVTAEEEEKPLYVDQQLNYDSTYHDANLSLDLQASSPPVPVAYSYTKQSQVQSVATAGDPSRPQIIASGKFEQPKLDAQRLISTDSEGDKVMRQDLEALYEEVSHSVSTEDIRSSSREETPTETYGMFVIPEQRHSFDSAAHNTSQEAVFAVTGHASGPVATSDDMALESEGKPKPWLVRVESFQTPEATLQTPQIVKPVSTEVEENLPVPKERKKKKKKAKKEKHLQHLQQDTSLPQSLPETNMSTSNAPALSASTDSLPRDNPPESPSPQHVSVPSSPTQDRPNGQHTLTVEQNSEAYSDYSDSECADGDKKRTASKKGSKKEGCKTQ